MANASLLVIFFLTMKKKIFSYFCSSCQLMVSWLLTFSLPLPLCSSFPLFSVAPSRLVFLISFHCQLIYIIQGHMFVINLLKTQIRFEFGKTVTSSSHCIILHYQKLWNAKNLNIAVLLLTRILLHYSNFFLL